LIGGSKIFVACDEPEMIASVVLVGPDLWSIEEVKGRKNKVICRDDWERLHDVLRDAGVTLVDQAPVK